MKKISHRFLCLLLGALLVLAPLMGRVAMAQALATELDVLAPVIELSPEQSASGVAGDAQVFSATITDNNVISSVILFHRFSEDPEYSSTEMLQNGDLNDYRATVITTAGDTRDLEYYIEAVDVAGNRAVLGFPFDPLRMPIAEPVPMAAPVDADTGREKLLWGIAGLLLLVLVVGAVGSGDSGGSAPEPGDPLVIEITESQ